MIDKNEFLEKYNIPLEKYNSSGVEWDNLIEIYKDYEKYELELNQVAEFIFNNLRNFEKVHSVKYRVKDKEHLIAKIIRKGIYDKPDLDFGVDNYKEKITDLIGLRILHLYKNDWTSIHQSITNTWELNEDVKIKHRENDNTSMYTEIDPSVKLEEHPAGYRSAHYLIKTSPTKNHYIAEIQVRTIFEEAWSEIDHDIRYPNHLNNDLLNQYLLIFNRLSGSADEMGSYINVLHNYLIDIENNHNNEIKSYDKKIMELNNKIKLLSDQINNLNISKAKKQNLESIIQEMNNSDILNLTNSMWKSIGLVNNDLDISRLENNSLKSLHEGLNFQLNKIKKPLP